MGEMVEFVGDFYFLRGREGAKRVVMMLIWKGFSYLVDFYYYLYGAEIYCID
ncbi:hypothetical protein SeHA_C2939 [Salmonella enterica subsp. enterica serovar Heidelberg str. SL476]|uniref:Uncharacterized protein n=1 Tax=Salmonella heidelberg (strain SL476) TaxID=454169 RepID=A0A6C6ZM71_SALHS|nr:hypothetical protein SeHA_C2939 [Salmonella enterica subsp. enterica serovar Heidelberg str. SL476]AKD09403.1 hypothetical protein AX05_34750 [Salmonella enterica subsp. enterica serovar Typhimurium str. CDC 2011K-0870]KJT78548.1 hypothetical protein SEEH3547_21386 [Salmonella enterica subsp. enterica serovar Heidelberg str. 75-3547]